MREFFELLNARLRTPIIGNSIIACFVLNWKSFGLLVFGSGEFEIRAEAFGESLSIWSFLVFPLLIGIVFSAFHPFVSLFGSWLVRWPTEVRRSMQLKSDSDFELEKQNLELERRRALALLEQEILEQAKRDEELSKIEDEDVRRKAEEQFSEVRKKLDSEKANSDSNGIIELRIEGRALDEMALEILVKASVTTDGIIKIDGAATGTTLKIGDETYLNTSENRMIVLAEAALSELWAKDLIENLNSKIPHIEEYRMTAYGYAVADAMKMDDPQHRS